MVLELGLIFVVKGYLLIDQDDRKLVLFYRDQVLELILLVVVEDDHLVLDLVLSLLDADVRVEDYFL